MSKWLWRFANKRDSLWRKVIGSKFGEDSGGWCSCIVRGPFSIGVWKEIIKEWESFPPTTLCSVGNGRRVPFWKDFWCGEEPLALTFASLFSLVVHKEAMVANMWDPVGEGGQSPHFSRSFNNWELEDFQSFLHVIQGKRVISNQEDLLLMKDVKDGRFLVKLFYKHLVPVRDPHFPFRFVWKPWVLSKVGFFYLGSFLG